MLLAFLAATAAIFAFALSNHSTTSSSSTTEARDLLLVVPYLAFGPALLLMQHNLVIHAIHEYLTKELASHLNTCAKAPPQWESSDALARHGLLLVFLTFFAQAVILLVPSVAALMLAPRHPSGSLKYAHDIGIIFCVGTFILLFVVLIIRRSWGNKTKNCTKPKTTA